MTYALLIYSGYYEGTPDAEANELLTHHRALQKELAKDDRLQGSVQLRTAPAAKVVRRDGRDFTLTDGPYLETREWLVGFYIIDGDEADAVAAAQTICPFNGHIELRPVAWMHKK